MHCRSVLHIILGIFQQLYTIFEDECHKLDLQLSYQSMPTSSTTFEQYHQTKVKVTAYKEEISSLSSELEQAQQILVLLLLSLDPNRVRLVSQLITTVKNSSSIKLLHVHVNLH